MYLQPSKEKLFEFQLDHYKGLIETSSGERKSWLQNELENIKNAFYA